MADSYLTLAADYDWLFGDDVLTGGEAISSPAAARLLQRTGRGSAVLDASCGTGINAEVLARRGFDVVLCVGNSLVHAAGRDAMVAALTGLRRMTRPGGHVVIDSRNWEKLNAERRIVRVANRVITRDGRRCVSFYAWEIPERLQDEHVAHIVFVFENGEETETHEYPISFRPFTVAELRERLELAGLREVDTDFDASADRYAVVAVAS